MYILYIYYSISLMLCDILYGSTASSVYFSIISYIYSIFKFEKYYMAMICIYFIYDLIKILINRNKGMTEYIFHHIYGILLFLFRNPKGDFLILIQYSELSTIFLNLIPITNDVYLKKLYQLIFVFLFMYVRMYYVFTSLLWLSYTNMYNPSFFDILPRHHWYYGQGQPERQDIFYMMDVIYLIPFLILHIYWMYKMGKKYLFV